MTQVLRTKQGQEIDTGFWAADTSRIQLGDMEPISIQQFSVYAVETLITGGVIEGLPHNFRSDWVEPTHAARVQVEQLRTITHENSELRVLGIGELFAKLDEGTDRQSIARAMATHMPWVAAVEFYESNPFVAKPSQHEVDFVNASRETIHTVEDTDFYYLTWIVLKGGIIGWNGADVYPEVVESLIEIDEAMQAA